MKIASLIPSGTDIACALGLQDSLVGISHECDFPGVQHLPILTRSSIDSTKSPAQIDADVNAAVASGESLYLTNRKLLRELAPDIVLTQTICDVCAVNSQTAARDLPLGAQLVNLSATSIEGLWDDLRTVAQASSTNAEPLIDELKSRLDNVQRFVDEAKRPRVLVLEWSDPPFLGGHWVPEMIEIAGGVHVLSGPGEPSRRATWEEIRSSKPQVVILAPCGYDLEQTIEQGHELLRHLPFRRLKCPVWATNATALFSRCTPATIRAVEVVAGILGADFEVSSDEAQRIDCGDGLDQF